jgi:hypothetical protein
VAQSTREQLCTETLSALDDAQQALEKTPVLGSPEWNRWAALYEKAVEAHDAYLRHSADELKDALIQS